MTRFWVFFYILCAVTSLIAGPKFKQGDVVALVGNGFVEREGLESYIETGLVLAHPDIHFSLRNFGWSGDTVKGASRGYFDENGYPNLLSKVSEVKPSVIILNYGSLAARDGSEGLAQFKEDYQKLIQDLKEKTKARIILMTPFNQKSYEPLEINPENYNKDLSSYVESIRGIAQTQQLQLIDLASNFSIKKDSWTSNSIHLTSEGYWNVGLEISKAFGWKKTKVEMKLNKKSIVSASGTKISEFSASKDSIRFKAIDDILSYPASPSGKSFKSLTLDGLNANDNYSLKINGEFVCEASGKAWSKGVHFVDSNSEKLREEIKAKNELFFHASRPQNTTYLFFFRKHEQGQNAKEVREIEKFILERDVKIGELKAPKLQTIEIVKEASKVVKQTEESLVPSDAGKNFVLNPEKEVKTFILPDDLQVNLFASEPMIVNPTNMNWDSEGRLWVCSAPTYPQIKPGQLANDKIIVLEDTNGDGRADKSTVFADGLLIPAAVIPGDGGAYVANSTELIHYEDTDGDLVADKKRIIFSGFGTEDTHHTLHTPRWGQDGMMYINQSIYIHSHVETPYGVSRLMAGGIWRFDTRKETFEVFTRGLVNTWGHQMDDYGQSFATDGAGSHGINYLFPDHVGLTAYKAKHIIKGMNPGQPKHCGLDILSSNHFPEKYRDLLIANDFRGHRTNAFRLTDSKSGYISKQVEDIISTKHKGTDRSGEGGGFRPVDVKVGPDGGLYLADWSNIIIQHGEVDFRDERRDRQNGRIWRITAKDRPLIKQPKIAGASMEQLLENLKSTERWTVDMSKREIMERPENEILEKVKDWATHLPEGNDKIKLHALWIYEGLGVCDDNLLMSLLESKDSKVKAAAYRVMWHFSDVFGRVMEFAEAGVRDSHARVRLESLHVLRRLKTTRAAEVAIKVLDKEMDETLDWTLKLTLRELEAEWAGQTTFNNNIAHINYAVKATGSTKALGALLTAFQNGTIPKGSQLDVLKTVANLGGNREADVLYNLIFESKFSDHEKMGLIKSLSESGKTRKIRPKVDFTKLKGLFKTNNENLLMSLCDLVGSWKVFALSSELMTLVDHNSETLAIQATKSLGALNHKTTNEFLLKLVSNGKKYEVQQQALIEWVSKDVQKAAKLVVELLNKLPASKDGLPLLNAFIYQSKGPHFLEQALKGSTIPERVAMAGVRAANVSGLSLNSLNAVFAQAGNLKPMKQVLSAAEMKAMVGLVQSKGNAKAGESIYRRQALACLNCHAIGGVGPEIGPDLISIGASAPVDYLIESILQPSKKIKEGYHMTMLSGHDGKFLSGAEVSSNSKSITLRDTAGTLSTWPMANVKKKEVVPMSMMPPGLTASLNEEEFIHLIAFLSKLGKEGDFKITSNDYVRSVEVVELDGKGRAAFIKKEDAFWANLNKLPWQKKYAKVDGFLPVETGSYKVLRFQLDVSEAGKVLMIPSTEKGLTLRDRKRDHFRARDGKIFAEFQTGKQYFYVGLEAKFSETQFRLELNEMDGNEGRYQLIK